MSLLNSNKSIRKKIELPACLMVIGLSLSFSMLMGVPTKGKTETYTWKDEHGRTHFGDGPPEKKPGVSVHQIEIKEKNPPLIDAEVIKRREKQYKLLEAYREESIERKELEYKQKEKAKRHKAACSQAKDNLRRYEGRTVFYRINEDGSRSYMSEVEKLKKLDGLRDRIKKNCK